MPLKYRIDVLAALKKQGYTTYRLRTEKLLPECAIQSLRKGAPISWQSIEKICELLKCQPGDIIVCEI